MVRRQWPGRPGTGGPNGGVHPDNVECRYDSALRKNVLVLRAHGDLYNGTGPIGCDKKKGAPEECEERPPTKEFEDWEWPEYTPPPCSAGRSSTRSTRT